MDWYSARRNLEMEADVTEDYHALAPVYDALGMGAFSAKMTPNLIDYAQRNEWVGRRVLDLGSGTGANFEWLLKHAYHVTGIDREPAMLEVARQRLGAVESDVTLHTQDIRRLDGFGDTADMVLALDVLNEVGGLRDLEAIFRGVSRALDPEKLFIFDAHTIQGLATAVGEHIVYDDAGLSVFTRDHFDYERQVHERHYIIYRFVDDVWHRSDARRTLRAFPAQAIASLLARCGFQIQQVLDLEFRPVEPGAPRADRVIFIAQK
jgi:SAM-dependent methyltransferase